MANVGGWVLQQRSGDDGKVVERYVGDWAEILNTMDEIVVNAEPGDFKFRLHWSPNERWESNGELRPKSAPIFEGDEEVEHDNVEFERARREDEVEDPDADVREDTVR